MAWALLLLKSNRRFIMKLLIATLLLLLQAAPAFASEIAYTSGPLDSKTQPVSDYSRLQSRYENADEYNSDIENALQDEWRCQMVDPSNNAVTYVLDSKERKDTSDFSEERVRVSEIWTFETGRGPIAYGFNRPTTSNRIPAHFAKASHSMRMESKNTLLIRSEGSSYSICTRDTPVS
jgi:hypothetical protein